MMAHRVRIRFLAHGVRIRFLAHRMHNRFLAHGVRIRFFNHVVRIWSLAHGMRIWVFEALVVMVNQVLFSCGFRLLPPQTQWAEMCQKWDLICLVFQGLA
jgi:hypothetical protein